MDLIERLCKTPCGRRRFLRERVILDATEGICKLMTEQGTSSKHLAKQCGMGKVAMWRRLSDGEDRLTISLLSDMAFHLGHKVKITFEKET